MADDCNDGAKLVLIAFGSEYQNICDVLDKETSRVGGYGGPVGQGIEAVGTYSCNEMFFTEDNTQINLKYQKGDCVLRVTAKGKSAEENMDRIIGLYESITAPKNICDVFSGSIKSKVKSGAIVAVGIAALAGMIYAGNSCYESVSSEVGNTAAQAERMLVDYVTRGNRP